MTSLTQTAKNNHLIGAREAVLQVYVAALVMAALVLALVLGLTYQLGGGLWAVIALMGVAALSERGRVQLSGTTESSIALLPVIFAAVVLGPLAALLVGAGSLLGDVRPPYMKLTVYTCTRAITGALAGFVAIGTAAIFESSLGKIAGATVAAALVAEVAATEF